MKRKVIISLLLACISILLVSCGGAAAPEMVEVEVMNAAVEEGQVVPEEPSLAVAVDQAVIYRAGADAEFSSSRQSDRMIIKNAEIKLLVENSDTAVDRTTQIIEDVGGYIISSRVWYEEWGDDLLKYSTITIGVPSDQFERTLRRLRDIAIRVLDENATGADVTDEFVDLQSQLENLEATRDRIRGFLDDADNVEEALRVNEELSKVEGQTEEIQGRINYLSDRAAYSTITITIEPELFDLPTPTPKPTITPTPWNASETYARARHSLVEVYKGIFNLAIWIGVVLIPVAGPFVLIGWFLMRYTRSRRTRKSDKKE
jgi:hypothetical protein